MKLIPGVTVILASASPRRKSLLETAGLEFRTVVSNAPEERLPGESPQKMVERLARLKAQDISLQNPAAWVIGCDTDVCFGDLVLGKPSDKQDAIRMLSLIAGNTHSVWGAFALLHAASGINYAESHETKVTMAAMSRQAIGRYVESGEPMDKAGAYAVQGICAQFIERIDGSYTNVVGLNICALGRALRRHGLIDE